MSATGLSDARRPDDFYKTPPATVRAVWPHLKPLVPRAHVLDPCCGDGAILDFLANEAPHTSPFGVELDEARADRAASKGHRVLPGSAFGPAPWGRPSLILTNPPFSLAMSFLVRSLIEVSQVGEVAFLLRLDWMATKGRVAFHKAHPSDVYVLDRRPSFCASLKCRAKCGWAVVQELDAPRPKECPGCGCAVSVTTSDSSEYAFFVFGPGRGGRWQVLEVE